MFSLEFTPIKFHTWYLQNTQWVQDQYHGEFGIPLDKDVQCGYCGGKGYHECDLGHSHDCEYCEGEGKTIKTPDEALEEYGMKLYKIQIERDRNKTIKFLKEQEHAG